MHEFQTGSSLNGGCTKLLVRSGPVVAGRPLEAPCQLVSIVSAVGERAPIMLGCGRPRPLCARPAPGPLFLLFAHVVVVVVVVRQLAGQVGRFPCTLARSVHHVHHVHGACSLCRLPAGTFRLLIAR